MLTDSSLSQNTFAIELYSNLSSWYTFKKKAMVQTVCMTIHIYIVIHPDRTNILLFTMLQVHIGSESSVI